MSQFEKAIIDAYENELIDYDVYENMMRNYIEVNENTHVNNATHISYTVRYAYESHMLKLYSVIFSVVYVFSCVAAYVILNF